MDTIIKTDSLKQKDDDFIQVVRYAPLVSIDLIVRNSEDKVLLGLRKNEPAKNTWFVPGGAVQKDEPLSQAFLRVTFNELGRKITRDSARFKGVFEHFYKTNFTGSSDFSTHYIVLAHEIDLDGDIGDLPDDQHRGFKWYTVWDLLRDDAVHDNTKAYFW